MKKIVKWIFLIIITAVFLLLSVYAYIYASFHDTYVLATAIAVGILIDTITVIVFAFVAHRLVSENCYQDDCFTKYFSEPVTATITGMETDDFYTSFYVCLRYDTEDYEDSKIEVSENFSEQFSVGDKITVYLIRGYNNSGVCIAKKFLLDKPHFL